MDFMPRDIPLQRWNIAGEPGPYPVKPISQGVVGNGDVIDVGTKLNAVDITALERVCRDQDVIGGNLTEFRPEEPEARGCIAAVKRVAGYGRIVKVDHDAVGTGRDHVESVPTNGSI